VKNGVANKVRDVATQTEDWQVLGRAHQLLPYVPLILTWPDKNLADQYLTQALQQDPKDLYNYFFLAELRFDQKRYADALDLIERGLSRGIRTNFFMEDKRGRWQLKELKKKINAKLDKK
jgi:tetratricopeptide (TPR) repeat protein